MEFKSTINNSHLQAPISGDRCRYAMKRDRELHICIILYEVSRKKNNMKIRNIQARQDSPHRKVVR